MDGDCECSGSGENGKLIISEREGRKVSRRDPQSEKDGLNSEGIEIAITMTVG